MLLLINAEAKKINEETEIKQGVVFPLSLEHAIPKERALLAPDLCLKVLKKCLKFLIPSSPIFIEERGVNICIWHSQAAECSKNSIQCLSSTFNSAILKPL